MDAVAGGFEAGAHDRDGRALAVGAGDMDHRRQLFVRVAERGEQALDPSEREVDLLRVELHQPRQDPVGRPPAVRAIGHSLRAVRAQSQARCPPGAARAAATRMRASVARSSARGTTMIDHAVLQEIFGALEPLGQLLADRLLDDPRAGEADDRARLGDGDVAQHRERGATRRRWSDRSSRTM